MSRRSSRKPYAFRLEEKEIGAIRRAREALEKSAGREVTLSQAVRAILEGFYREERRAAGEDLPHLSDAELLDLPRVK